MRAQPYLFFDGRCEEAVESYRSTLGALGPYALQGAIAACPARAGIPAETDREDVRSHLEEA